MMKWLVFVTLSLILNCGFANVALNELNSLLTQKKTQTILMKAKEKRLKILRENYYFILIYRSTCPHCHKFVPILSDFSKTFQIPVEAYSLDGESLAGFDAKALTPDLFQTLYVSGGYQPVVPALFLVNRSINQAYAVLFGEAEPAQLARRVDELMTHLEEKFHE